MWSTSWKTALGVESLAADLPDLSVTNAILGLLFIGGFTMAFVKYVRSNDTHTHTHDTPHTQHTHTSHTPLTGACAAHVIVQHGGGTA
jgi:hypothetical protein